MGLSITLDQPLTRGGSAADPRAISRRSASVKMGALRLEAWRRGEPLPWGWGTAVGGLDVWKFGGLESRFREDGGAARLPRVSG